MTRIGLGLLVTLLLMAGAGETWAKSCTTDGDCQDGFFCTGSKSCFQGTCVAVDTCPAAVQGCLIYGSCDEATRSCPAVPTNSLCPEGLVCAPSGDCVAAKLASAMGHLPLLMLGVMLGGSGVVWSSRRGKRT